MKVSVGLPNVVPGASGDDLLEFARRAERRGFASVGAIDRLLWDCHEPLTALSAAAAVTDRIGLFTSILIAPLRPNAVELAKRARTLNAISHGRLTLGVGLGARDDDYEASGVERAGLGRTVNEMLERMTAVWDGGEVGPSAGAAPKLIVGGHADASFARVARFADGWISGGAPASEYPAEVARLERAWTEAGRDGEPRRTALLYFSLGEQEEAAAREFLLDYHAFLPRDVAESIADGSPTDGAAVREQLVGFEDAGCDELVLFPCSSDPGQVDRLADLAGL